MQNATCINRHSSLALNEGGDECRCCCTEISFCLMAALRRLREYHLEGIPMRLNRKWILVTALVLSMFTAISGTLAYLTSTTNTAVNTFTLGNVDIELLEPSWTEGSEPLLAPGVEIPKDPQIHNKGALAAWVWMEISMPKDLYDTLDIDWDATGEWIIDPPKDANADPAVVIAKRKDMLPAGQTSAAAFDSVMLPATLTSIPQALLDLGKVQIAVKGYAIQDANFADINAAMAAFGTNGGTAVTNLDQLKAEMAKGGTVYLANDIEMDNMIKIEEGVDLTLNLNGKTLSFEPNADFKPGNPMFYPLTGSKLTITGNGTVDLGDSYAAALVCPAGEVVIENGTFIRDRVPEGTSPDDVQTLFIGVKSVGASVVIKDGYFDGGYYDKNADAAFSENAADIANRGKAADKNLYRTAIKNNTSLLLNLSWSSAAGTQDFRIYGGTFVGANPAWGDEGCAMPIDPEYKRPWSYYQGMFLEGQQMHDDKIEIPAGYTITESKTADGRPVFTVNYSK